MNSTTLQALRRLLFFTQSEAATLIGNVSERSWIHWERDTRPVPKDVETRILDLASWRKNAIDTASEVIAESARNIHKGSSVAPAALIWYASIEDWMTMPGREPVLWRPQCSAVAHLCASFGCVTVRFDGPAYAKWLKETRHPDLEQARGMWAAEQVIS